MRVILTHEPDTSQVTPLSTPARWSALLAGMGATLPLALGIVPYMAIYGVLAGALLAPAQAQVMTLLVFAGAQLPAVQLLHGGSPLLLAGLSLIVLNLRHLGYSAALAPTFRRLSVPWRLVLGYLVTDETFATTTARLHASERRSLHWFLLGSGACVWLAAQGATAAGVFLGAAVPASWSLDATAPLAFLSLAVIHLKDQITMTVALVAGGAVFLLAGLPWQVGRLAALGLGVLAGHLAERLRRAPLAGTQEVAA
jgi:predicted branched-subunit amino acid permease